MLEPVNVPVTAKLPLTVALSLIVVSEVPCPIDIGTAEVAVPIVMPLDVLEQSMLSVLVLSRDRGFRCSDDLF